MSNKKHTRFFYKWHGFLAALVGVQVVIWLLSGLIMTFFPIEKVRSEHRFAKAPSKQLQLKHIPQHFKDLNFCCTGNTCPTFIKSILVKPLLGKTMIQIQDEQGKHYLFDTQKNKIISPLSKDMAELLAKSRYVGNEGIKHTQWLKKESSEYKGEIPVWKVDFDNKEATSFYVSPTTGDVVKRRSRLWRVYDFFWMLHIMDYWERSNFNSWWLIAFAFLALLMSLTGLILVYRKISLSIKRSFSKALQ